MRQKKRYQVITFSTTASAMAMEQYCMAQGIPGRLIPVPTQLTAGCGLAWRMGTEEYRMFEAGIQASEIETEGSAELLL